MSTELDVYCYGEPAGRLSAPRSGELSFVYASSWIEAGRPPISHSLPTGRSPEPASVHAYFDGLLPEGSIREMVARTVHVSPANTAGLLAELGWDCAGALSVYPVGDIPVSDGDGSDVDWLDDEHLASLIDELPRRPLRADETGDLRISLAGVQDKLPVVVNDAGQIGLAHGDRKRNRRTPSTHILKTRIERLPDSVANEAFCLRLASELGLRAASAEPRRVAGREFLLVRRYDRRRENDGRVIRMHQEDFCQALGSPSDRKYEAEGGPGLPELFSTLRESSAVPAVDLPRLLDAVTFNLLIGNHDAHAKNYSIIYDEAGAASLAPLYDLVSTFAYRAVDRQLSAKLAMKIGGEYRADRVMARHLNRFFDQCQLNPVAARRRMTEIIGRSIGEAEKLVGEFDAAGWGVETIDRIVELVRARGERMLGELG